MFCGNRIAPEAPLGTREEPCLFEYFGFVRNRQPAATPSEGLKERPPRRALSTLGCLRVPLGT